MDEKRGAEAPLWYGFIKSLEGMGQADSNRVRRIAREDVRCARAEARKVIGTSAIIIQLDVAKVPLSTLGEVVEIADLILLRTGTGYFHGSFEVVG